MAATQSDSSPHGRLASLVGRWKTEGWTRETPEAPAIRVDAVDTYEWLPGGFGLLHIVDAKMGGEQVEGAEIIGYDPDVGAYATQYVGSEGLTRYRASLTQESGRLTWRMRGETTRFTGTFSPDGNVITGQWELLPESGNWQPLLSEGRDWQPLLPGDGAWQPWMDITLTKQER